jgi:restriction system protein
VDADGVGPTLGFRTKKDGVPPIELVDGEKLVTIIEQLELGLGPIKAFKLDESLFAQFKS